MLLKGSPNCGRQSILSKFQKHVHAKMILFNTFFNLVLNWTKEISCCRWKGSLLKHKAPWNMNFLRPGSVFTFGSRRDAPFHLLLHSWIILLKYRKSRCISWLFETTNPNRAKLLDLDLYTESKSIRSITKNTRCCAWF